MKDIGRTLLLSTWISGIVLAFGCGDDPSSPPLAPSPSAVADRGQWATVNHGPAAAWNDGVGGPASASSVDRNTAGLKSTAPEPVSPIDDAEIDDPTPVLTASKATGVYEAADFEHEFTISRITGGNQAEIERGSGISQGAGVTSYRVRKRLGLASSYSWRVRAVSGGEYGPWSADARFRTAAVILGTPRPLFPIRGEAASIRPVFRVRNGAVEGNAGTVSIQVQVAADGDFADIVARPQARAASGENTEVRLGGDLMPEKTYFWRARAMSSAGRRSGSWSAAATFRTVTVPAPTLVSPVNGAEVSSRPIFRVRSSTVMGDVNTIRINIQVASDEGFANVVGKGSEQAEAEGRTDIRLQSSLMPSTSYFWRARVVAIMGPSDTVASVWSRSATFRTAATSSWPQRPSGGHPPNMLHVVQRVANEHPEKLAASWDRANRRWIESNKEFLDLVIDALRSVDARWAYNCVRGNCNRVSIDGAAYYRGAGTERNAQDSTDVAIIDFLAGQADGSTPQPAWFDITEETRENNTIGRWKYPRPGR